jgi:hypothetical protein
MSWADAGGNVPAARSSGWPVSIWSHASSRQSNAQHSSEAAERFVALARELKSNPDLDLDLRAMVPVFYDVRRRKPKVWAFAITDALIELTIRLALSDKASDAIEGELGWSCFSGASEFTPQLGGDVSGARRLLPIFCDEYFSCTDLKLIKARISTRPRIHNQHLF